MASKRKKKDLFYVHNCYRDGLYIPHRKRTYLYWFKFLQEAERSPDYEVNWSKYRKWGGRKAVMNSKFGTAGGTLEILFGMKERMELPRFNLNQVSQDRDNQDDMACLDVSRPPQTMSFRRSRMEGELSIRNEVPTTSQLLVGSLQQRNAEQPTPHQ